MPLLLENNLKKVYEASRLLGVSREKARKDFFLKLMRHACMRMLPLGLLMAQCSD